LGSFWDGVGEGGRGGVVGRRRERDWKRKVGKMGWCGKEWLYKGLHNTLVLLIRVRRAGYELEIEEN
jgi:hypothetical protein